MVVTNDSHYVRQGESPLQDIYICIQTNTTVQDEKRLRMEDDSYYVKTPGGNGPTIFRLPPGSGQHPTDC